MGNKLFVYRFPRDDDDDDAEKKYDYTIDVRCLSERYILENIVDPIDRSRIELPVCYTLDDRSQTIKLYSVTEETFTKMFGHLKPRITMMSNSTPLKNIQKLREKKYGPPVCIG